MVLMMSIGMCVSVYRRGRDGFCLFVSRLFQKWAFCQRNKFFLTVIVVFEIVNCRCVTICSVCYCYLGRSMVMFSVLFMILLWDSRNQVIIIIIEVILVENAIILV